ncbi:antitoxin Xre/MbcA/ParS toxin-binding domain-containing protein [Pseudoalteromonas phenolica]|uniref:antitoxin Xre/MbcA/ParS toxin-binding domain-containing protein n=1 Tax=Pseudoalteromonas phenolica TaxID=161398 RepID=UPI00110A4142|nr:antitoxin Xre/MbcA/ParS toxin-binding domain-containing protein [Pseudoalteromonas phenolica]TMO53289.1 DUF2384 domain-containing protein [Pseudoalteromonas phenolica]
MSNEELSKVGLKTFINIMHQWDVEQNKQSVILGLDIQEVLKESALGNEVILPDASLIRISHIIRIYKSLRMIFASENQANAWIHKPNASFDGNSALKVILGGKISDLEKVSGYLQGQVDIDLG